MMGKTFASMVAHVVQTRKLLSRPVSDLHLLWNYLEAKDWHFSYFILVCFCFQPRGLYLPGRVHWIRL